MSNAKTSEDVENAYARLVVELKTHGQEHLLKFWDCLTLEEKSSLVDDLEAINFADVNLWFARATGAPTNKLDELMTPVEPQFEADAMAFPYTTEMQEWENIGLKLVSDGKVCLLLLAGGQGTRLGSTDPKGMFPLGLESGETLYSLQAHRILTLQKHAQKLYGGEGKIAWLIMTSEATGPATTAFFKSNNYFGLDADQITVFDQALIPSYDMEGKLFLDTKCSVARSPNGNGGLYEALKAQGLIGQLKAKGVEFVHIYCVDNILVKVADPVFLGYLAAKKVPAAAKAVKKSQPHEKVGVICKVEGKFQVVEYSEITPATATRTDGKGALMFQSGNICNHAYTMEFLEIACDQFGKLNHHIAKKKIPFVNSAMERIEPATENGIKLELYVFDVFQFASQLAVLNVCRENEFSPLKNKSGAADGTVEHCRQDLYALHRKFYTAAGGTIAPAAQAVPCEISSLITYAGEGLSAIVQETPELAGPVYFRSS